MPTTTYKQYPLPTQGVTTTWGDALNNYPFTDIDRNLGGIVTKSVSSSNITLTDTESQCLILRLIGTLTANIYVATTCQGLTLVENLTSGPFNIIFGNTLSYGSGLIGPWVTLPQGGRYVVASDTTNGSRLVLPAASSVAQTIGMVGYFPGRTPPSGWLKANGSFVSRTTYAALFNWANVNAMVTEATWSFGYYGWFAQGDGISTFRLPDIRGTFIRSWADDSTSSINYGRDAGTFQDQSLMNHQHTGTTGGQTADHTHSKPRGLVNNGQSIPVNAGGLDGYGNHSTLGTSNDHAHHFTTDVAGNGSENRPQSMAMMACIAYV